LSPCETTARSATNWLDIVSVPLRPKDVFVVYENRARAESFGALAEDYDTYRPTYPAAMIDDLCAAGHPRVLDVGCGTGKAARLFVERGCEVIGIEVDERMADRARANGIDVEVAAFETWKPRDRTFDLVTAGQSWHWMNPETAPHKAADVLAPGGHIGVFWNQSRPHDPDLEKEVSEAAAGRAGNRFAEPKDWQHRHDVSEHAEAIDRSGRFSPCENRSYEWQWQVSNEHWIALWRTWSEVATMPDNERNALLSDISAVLDRFGREILFDYVTECIYAERLTTAH
jgi:SAM-dependent methyltransferase